MYSLYSTEPHGVMASLSVLVMTISGFSESSPQYENRNPTCMSNGLGS